MKHLVYACLGLLIVCSSSLKSSPGPQEYLYLLRHLETIDEVLHYLESAIGNNSLKVTNKEVASAHLLKARTSVQNLLKSEDYGVLEQRHDLQFVLASKTIILALMDKLNENSQLTPMDKVAELAAQYSDVLLALFPYVKENNKERLEEELSRPDSALMRLGFSWAGIAVALGLCVLDPVKRESLLQEIYRLNTILEGLKQAIAADKLEVSDKKAVSEYLTRVREALQWSSGTAASASKRAVLESWRSFIEPTVKQISDTWQNSDKAKSRRKLVEAMEKKTKHAYSMTDPLIDTLLILRSVEECYQTAYLGNYIAA